MVGGRTRKSQRTIRRGAEARTGGRQGQKIRFLNRQGKEEKGEEKGEEEEERERREGRDDDQGGLVQQE